MYDIIIIGGGTAAMSAGIYAGRKKLNVVMVAGEIGGQTALQPEFWNYPGFVDADGYKLVQNMLSQVKSQGSVELREPWMAQCVSVTEENGKKSFVVANAAGEEIGGRAVIVATGGQPKHLNVPGEREYENKGVTYCATCDAPLFVGKRTAVVGGGNTGTEAALLLTKYASSVYLLHRGSVLKADEVTRGHIIAAGDKITVIYNSSTKEILGERGKVKGLRYMDGEGREKELAVEGVFVAVGFTPNSALVKDLVSLDALGQIIIDPKTNMTSVPGIFAAGDVTDVLFNQAVIAAGEAAKAALAAHRWLMQHGA